MCYGRGLLSTQVGQSVHPPNQQGQAQAVAAGIKHKTFTNKASRPPLVSRPSRPPRVTLAADGSPGTTRPAPAPTL
jgi:hypothetical protein